LLSARRCGGVIACRAAIGVEITQQEGLADQA